MSEASEGLSVDREGGRLRPNLVPPEPTLGSLPPGRLRHPDGRRSNSTGKPDRDRLDAGTPVSGLGTNLEGSSRSTNLPPSADFAQDESSSAVVVEKPSGCVDGNERFDR